MLVREMDLEELLAVLRKCGVSKVVSIRVLAELGYALSQAKELVHHSQTWSDVAANDEAFHEDLAGATDE